ncbi:MAG: RNA chaperone Hfq [Leptonema sp. (in: bacteria)]
MSGKFGALEQNQIIDKARKRRLNVQVFLKNGAILKGKIVRFDLFTILLKSSHEYIVVFKHAISTLIPLKDKKKSKNTSKDIKKEKYPIEKNTKKETKKIQIKKRKNDL